MGSGVAGIVGIEVLARIVQVRDGIDIRKNKIKWYNLI